MTDRSSRLRDDVQLDLAMTDEQLRSWYQQRAAAVRPTQVLVEDVMGIPESVPTSAAMLDWLPSRRLLLLLATAALLIALSVGAAIVGSWLVRRQLTDQFPVPPAPTSAPGPIVAPAPTETAAPSVQPTPEIADARFGPPRDCSLEPLPAIVPNGHSLPQDAVLLLDQDDHSTRLDAAGNLVTWQPPASSVQNIGLPAEPILDATYTHQRLTQHGVDRVIERVTEAGVAGGCRMVASDASSPGSALVLQTGSDVSALMFNTAYFRVDSQHDEQVLGQLIDDLRDPSGWLGPEDLIDPAPATYVPERWTVTVFRQPAFTGTDPASKIEMPGGNDLASFGEPVSGSGSGWLHCGEANHADAQQIVASLLDAGATLDQPGHWVVDVADGEGGYVVTIVAVVPGENRCAALMAGSAGLPTPPPTPVGDLSAADACALVPAGWDAGAGLGGIGESNLPFDVASPACPASPSGEDPWWADTARINLRGASTSLEEARSWAQRLLGPGSREEAINGRTVWFSAVAFDQSDDRQAAFAISDGPYFYVVVYTFEPTDPPQTANEREAVIRQFVNGSHPPVDAPSESP